MGMTLFCPLLFWVLTQITAKKFYIINGIAQIHVIIKINKFSQEKPQPRSSRYESPHRYNRKYWKILNILKKLLYFIRKGYFTNTQLMTYRKYKHLYIFLIALGPNQANLLAGYALTFMIFMKYFQCVRPKKNKNSSRYFTLISWSPHTICVG